MVCAPSPKRSRIRIHMIGVTWIVLGGGRAANVCAGEMKLETASGDGTDVKSSWRRHQCSRYQMRLPTASMLSISNEAGDDIDAQVGAAPLRVRHVPGEIPMDADTPGGRR